MDADAPSAGRPAIKLTFGTAVSVFAASKSETNCIHGMDAHALPAGLFVKKDMTGALTTSIPIRMSNVHVVIFRNMGIRLPVLLLNCSTVLTLA